MAGLTKNNAPKLAEGTLTVEVIEASLFKDVESDGTQMDPFVQIIYWPKRKTLEESEARSRKG